MRGMQVTTGVWGRGEEVLIIDTVIRYYGKEMNFELWHKKKTKRKRRSLK